MKYLYIILTFLTLVSCNDMKVGYLEAEKGFFSPNILEIKKNLDPVEDKKRIEQKIPWVSYPIQGIQGTLPIKYELINAVETKGGSSNELLKNAFMRGDGALEINFENNIPVGEYKLDIQVSNEGYSHILEAALTIKVK